MKLDKIIISLSITAFSLSIFAVSDDMLRYEIDLKDTHSISDATQTADTQALLNEIKKRPVDLSLCRGELPPLLKEINNIQFLNNPHDLITFEIQDLSSSELNKVMSLLLSKKITCIYVGWEDFKTQTGRILVDDHVIISPEIKLMRELHSQLSRHIVITALQVNYTGGGLAPGNPFCKIGALKFRKVFGIDFTPEADYGVKYVRSFLILTDGVITDIVPRDATKEELYKRLSLAYNAVNEIPLEQKLKEDLQAAQKNYQCIKDIK